MITMENVLALADLLDEVTTATHEELLAIGCDPEQLLAEGYVTYVGSGLYEATELDIDLLDIGPEAVGYQMSESKDVYCKECFFDPVDPCWQEVDVEDQLKSVTVIYRSDKSLQDLICVNCEESLLEAVMSKHQEGGVQ